jgi:fumarylacetoacetase
MSKNSDFTIHNIPFGIFSIKNKPKRLATIIGDQVVDLFALAELGYFDDLKIKKTVFKKDYLNDFMALGKGKTNAVRLRLQEILINSKKIPPFPTKSGFRSSTVFYLENNVKLHLPIQIGDYTDFYSSIEHATNVGKMFRDPEYALLPNWRHIPVGYHGRSSSIVVSGVPIHRPKGQVKLKDASFPVFQPTDRLDFELETGFIIGRETALGESISIEQAEEYIFGKVLFNDWSARDIQAWEYVPLGPFLGKNFASAVSPWVVTMEALAPFRVKGPEQEPQVLPYLQYTGDKNIDIHLEVSIMPKNGEKTVVSRSNFKYMYWNMAQQLAHHTVNGCNIRVGDLMGSGTISGKDNTSYGSMLELSWLGTKPIPLKDGSQRIFIEDNDTVIMRGYCEKDGIRVGFGTLSTEVLSAKH